METKKLTCGCDNNYLCGQAERLWKMADNIYYTKGFDAWKECEEYKQYQEHRDGSGGTMPNFAQSEAAAIEWLENHERLCGSREIEKNGVKLVKINDTD